MEGEYIDDLLPGGHVNGHSVVTSTSPPEPLPDDEREQLYILVASGKSKEMVGKTLTREEVKNMCAPEVQKLHKRYETAVASRTSDALADSVPKLARKVVGVAVPLDSVEALHEDLLSDHIINQELKALCGSPSLRCGRLMALAVGCLHVAKHVYVSKIPELLLRGAAGGAKSDTLEDVGTGDKE